MKKGNLISSIISIVGVMMMSIGMFIQTNGNITTAKMANNQDINIKKMSVSAKDMIKETKQEIKSENPLLTEIKMETAPAGLLRIEVYQGMTMEELSAKLNRSLGGILAGHGNTIASHSLEIGVDPYIAAAIMIHETGNGTSRIANGCYNFGGQKGSGCGAYKRYGSVDEGLRGMIDNLYRNYYAHGLKTVESIGPRYAESGDWPAKINSYINQIKSR